MCNCLAKKRRAEALRIYVVLTNCQSGLEPETCSLAGSRSIQLSYWIIINRCKITKKYLLRIWKIPILT